MYSVLANTMRIIIQNSIRLMKNTVFDSWVDDN